MLLVNEIYKAISGESRFMGWPCTLVRLTGCHIRCSWCDSEHSFSGGQSMTVDAIVEQVQDNGLRTVLLTGGEPLLQAESVDLMQALLDNGYRVLLETSGTLMSKGAVALKDVPAGVHRVVDLKAPGSGIGSKKIDWQGLGSLGGDDEIKVVCAHREDYEWARDLVRAGGRWQEGLRIGFSPVQGSLQARDLAEWILEDCLDVCFQIQLHKAVWPDVDRGV
jgi:7-carboxy-7-deazaguanine synthase